MQLCQADSSCLKCLGKLAAKALNCLYVVMAMNMNLPIHLSTDQLKACT